MPENSINQHPLKLTQKGDSTTAFYEILIHFPFPRWGWGKQGLRSIKQEKIYRWEKDSMQQIQASGVSGHCQAWG